MRLTGDIRDTTFWQSAEKFRIFVDLCMIYEETGSVPTGYEMAKKWRYNMRSMYRLIDDFKAFLENEGNIVIDNMRDNIGVNTNDNNNIDNNERVREGGDNMVDNTRDNVNVNIRETSPLMSPHKETERSKEKEIYPPIIPPKESTPLKKSSLKVKNACAREEMERRKKNFYLDLTKYLGEYDRWMLREFYDYWSEENRSGTKMRWEQERTWDLNLRLKRWASRSWGSYGGVRDDALRKEQAEEAERIRIEEKRRFEEELERRNAEAVSYDQWVEMRDKK